MEKGRNERMVKGFGQALLSTRVFRYFLSNVLSFGRRGLRGYLRLLGRLLGRLSGRLLLGQLDPIFPLIGVHSTVEAVPETGAFALTLSLI